MDTIAAISTVQAPSAIGILRITGEKTLSVMERVFHPLNGKPMGEQEPRRLICGTVLDREGRQIDSAMGVYFRGPNSYTGEDSGGSGSGSGGGRPFSALESGRSSGFVLRCWRKTCDIGEK